MKHAKTSPMMTRKIFCTLNLRQTNGTVINGVANMANQRICPSVSVVSSLILCSRFDVRAVVQRLIQVTELISNTQLAAKIDAPPIANVLFSARTSVLVN